MVKERQLLRGGRKQAPLYPYESLIPEATNTRDVGSSSREYRDVHIGRSGYIDYLSVSGSVILERDDAIDIGTSTVELRNIYVDATGKFDILHADTELRGIEGTTTGRSGLGTFFVLRGAKPYVAFYISGVANHIWASCVLHTGSKSW